MRGAWHRTRPVNQPRTYSPKDVAIRLGLSVKVVRGAIRRGELTAFRYGRTLLIEEGDLVRWRDRARARARGVTTVA